MKKSLIIATSAATIGLASLLGIGMVSAEGIFKNQSDLVSALADKFNLNESDVQAVFDEHHAANVAARQAEYQDRLTQAVEDGDLTQAQADLLTAKHQEMADFMETLKDKTAQERRTALQTKRSEFKQWCLDNDIPSSFNRMMGSGRGMGMGMRNSDNE